MSAKPNTSTESTARAGSAHPLRAISFGNPAVDIERRDDGTIYLRPKAKLADYPVRITDRLHHWAKAAPGRVFMAERDASGAWRQITYAQCRTLGELLARVVLRELGDIATITRHVTKRGDKVYLDYLQNRHGQLIVAPFSVRPLPGASVSMPLTWDEVDQSLDPRAFTIKTAIERMERLGRDPVAPVLDDKPDLAKILEKLAPML